MRVSGRTRSRLSLATLAFLLVPRVPGSARAVALNVTETEADDPANSAVVTLGFEGEVVVRSDQQRGSVQVVLDVSGYFE